MHLNDVGVVNLSLASPIAFEPYAKSRSLGSFIVIDRLTNETAGAGTIDFALRRGTNLTWQHLDIDRSRRAALNGQKPAILWFAGLSGARKSTIANPVERKLFADAGLIVIASFISPYRADRAMARSDLEEGIFLEVFVDTPIEECKPRDAKGLYAKVAAGKISNFTGADAPYEAPENPEIKLKTIGHSAESLAEQVIGEPRRRGIVA